MGINLNNSEALKSLSSQQSKDLFFFFAQTFRIPHTVRVHTSIIIKEEVFISIFWKKNVKNAFNFDLKRTFPSCQIYIDAVPKRTICENGSQWCEHSSMNLNCSAMEVHIIEGLLCDVRKSNSWFLLSKCLTT